jgi:hypothetical protein
VILVLDDDPVRHRAFKRGLIGTSVVHVTRADQAVMQLADTGPWRVVCLDHDLDQHGDLTAGDGMQVVKWICGRTRFFKTALFVVHSINPVRAPQMVAKLHHAGLTAVAVPRMWEDDEGLARLVALDRT